LDDPKIIATAFFAFLSPLIYRRGGTSGKATRLPGRSVRREAGTSPIGASQPSPAFSAIDLVDVMVA
jgi:hypothetical protein